MIKPDFEEIHLSAAEIPLFFLHYTWRLLSHYPKTSKWVKSLMLNYGEEWLPDILAPVLL